MNSLSKLSGDIDKSRENQIICRLRTCTYCVPSFDAEIRRENWILVDSCAFCGGGLKKILNHLIIRILIGNT